MEDINGDIHQYDVPELEILLRAVINEKNGEVFKLKRDKRFKKKNPRIRLLFNGGYIEADFKVSEIRIIQRRKTMVIPEDMIDEAMKK